jgi:hypothetical protein
MEFGQFRIARFRKEQLDSLTGKSINEVYYPWAVVDSKRMCQYWFLCVQEKDISPPIGLLPDFSESARVDNRYTKFPSAVEPAIQLLTLFDWDVYFLKSETEIETTTEDPWRFWQGFKLPIIIRVHDSLYETPWPCPSFAELNIETIFDDQTGQELGERPQVLIRLEGKETESFRLFVSQCRDLLTLLRLDIGNPWYFFEIALRNLTKAFFAEDLDQLLWHITAIEALVGERGR